MDRTIVVSSSEINGVSLRSAGVADLENLRAWKNANRESFFFRGVISPSDQQGWYQAYLGRPDDYMFIVHAAGVAAGCMAFRCLGDKLDVYNVILGTAEMGGKGVMSKALRIMCSYALDRYARPVTLNVLKTNPAVSWYLKNHFVQKSDEGEYLALELGSSFRPCLVEAVDEKEMA